MSVWTTRQEELLKAYARQGAAAAAEAIWRETGVRRSAEATRRHAYRIGVSTERLETCPACGRSVKALSPATGYCKGCTARRMAERIRAHTDAARRNQAEYEAYRTACVREYRTAQKAHERSRRHVTT
jgi:hypothetical protein